MICTFVCFAPCVVYAVGLVEPVELRGIWRGHVVLQRGTGGTGVVLGSCWRINVVPPVTPTGTTKNEVDLGQCFRRPPGRRRERRHLAAERNCRRTADGPVCGSFAFLVPNARHALAVFDVDQSTGGCR